MINLKFGLRHGFKNKNNNKNSTYIPQMNQLWQEMKKKKTLLTECISNAYNY